MSKTNTEINRSYKFDQAHQTTQVKFCNYDTENDKLILLVESSIDTISKNNYSLNYTDYLVDDDDYVENQIFSSGNNFNNIKCLNDVCFFKSGRQISRANLIAGIYPVIGGEQQPIGTHCKFNKEKNTILCSSSGTAGFISKYDSEVWASDCFSIHSKDINILDEKYLYYYIKSIQSKIYKLQTGTAQPHVYPKTIGVLKIPALPLEQQKAIINFFENNQIKIKKLETEIKNLKDMENNYISNFLKNNGNNGNV